LFVLIWLRSVPFRDGFRPVAARFELRPSQWGDCAAGGNGDVFLKMRRTLMPASEPFRGCVVHAARRFLESARECPWVESVWIALIAIPGASLEQTVRVRFSRCFSGGLRASAWRRRRGGRLRCPRRVRKDRTEAPRPPCGWRWRLLGYRLP